MKYSISVHISSRCLQGYNMNWNYCNMQTTIIGNLIFRDVNIIYKTQKHQNESKYSEMNAREDRPKERIIVLSPLQLYFSDSFLFQLKGL